MLKHFTLTMFLALVTTVQSVAELSRNAIRPVMTDILAIHATQDEAEKICQNKGMRLPTPRELALFAQSNGAEGISETEKDGYRLIRGTDSTGKPDYFYYSKKGYESPDADLRYYWFWSSSVKPEDPLVAYTLMDDGDIGYSRTRAYYYNIDAVRCVR